MKRNWSEQELELHWYLPNEEQALLANMTARNRLGFAILLKFFQAQNRFPVEHGEIAPAVLDYVAAQVRVHPKHFRDYALEGRTASNHHTEIRLFCGIRRPSAEDGQRLIAWLIQEVLPHKHQLEQLTDTALGWYREQRLEAPAADFLDRLVRSAMHAHEEAFFATVSHSLTDTSKQAIDALLAAAQATPELLPDNAPVSGPVTFNDLKADPGRAGLDSVLAEIAKLQCIDRLQLPANLFAGALAKQLAPYRQRAASEPPSELKLRVAPVRYTMVAAYCWQRRREILDGLVELLIQIVHRISVSAERRVEKELLNDFRAVRGKTTLLFKMAEAVVGEPDGVIKSVLYPVVGEQTLKDLVKEYKATGPAWRKVVHTIMRASYSGHYRRMLPHLLDNLRFRSNNAAHRPIIDALDILKQFRDSRLQYFPEGAAVPRNGVIAAKWSDIVLEKDKHGVERINRINYEICVLQALREGLRSKEIWVEGADRFRNPDEDLPDDFDAKRDSYYADLGLPRDAAAWIADLKQEMANALAMLNKGMPHNAKVKILERGPHKLSVSPLDVQAEPRNIAALKTEILRRWPATSLLDIFKEAELRSGFTQAFQTSASRETLDRDTLQRRLLLCLYGLGTNAGLKRVLNGDEGTSYKELLYTRRRFIRKESLRSAIAQVVNAIFAARDTTIWGEGTTACGSDSKKFGSWDQNLMTEWHIRYGGRGVMIYWHVERNSTCIYSQLKRCSSSEVAAMIEGVLRHCTDMEVEKNYVDSHG